MSLVDEFPEWLAYELPPEARSDKTGRGQVQKWFLVRYLRSDDNIDLTTHRPSEFTRWVWVPVQELVDRAWSVRQPIYRRLAESWSHALSGGQ